MSLSNPAYRNRMFGRRTLDFRRTNDLIMPSKLLRGLIFIAKNALLGHGDQ